MSRNPETKITQAYIWRLQRRADEYEAPRWLGTFVRSSHPEGATIPRMPEAISNYLDKEHKKQLRAAERERQANAEYREHAKRWWESPYAKEHYSHEAFVARRGRPYFGESKGTDASTVTTP